MPKAIYESLQMDLPALAEMLRRKGRGKDTILAHITPKEAELLKKRGGRGSTNPDTGLLEFETDFGGDMPVYSGGQELTPAQVAQQNPDLYAGGQLPAAGQGTVYTPATDTTAPSVAYQPTTTTTPSPTPSPYDVEDLAAGQTAGKVPTGQAVTGGYYPEGATVYSPIKYSPEDLSRISVGVAPVQEITTDTTKQPTFRQSLEKALQDPATLAKLGLVGGGGLLGAIQASKGAQQAADVQSQIAAVGAPYTATGQALQAAAQRGELTPASQQAYQAAQAQLQQNIATRGGVGAQQAANQLANVYQSLLTNQFNQGLQVAGIGDSYQINAIQTGLQADQTMQNNVSNLFKTVAAVAFAIPTTTTTTAQRTNI
jgi:hypothetical protein